MLVFELMEGGDLSKFLLQRQKEAIAEGAMLSAFHYALPEDEARHVFGQVILRILISTVSLLFVLGSLSVPLGMHITSIFATVTSNWKTSFSKKRTYHV